MGLARANWTEPVRPRCVQGGVSGLDLHGWGQLSGVLDITDFEATATSSKGGAAMEIGYTVGKGDPPLQNLKWI